MDISRGIKDIVLITPWIISFILFTCMNLFIYLFLLLWSNLIFIYKSNMEKYNVK